ncbi:IclR family transcriptional regulator [Microbacterium sp. A93]|uniref:IclR family transcriptional regulator n=1 Tax=Microbacterium sp. A93 TaxID=3450716 RepID=UPI003F4401E2
MDDSRHRALSRGMRLLEAIAESRGGATITELSELTGIDKSSVSRLVTTLADIGYVARVESRKVVLTGRVLGISKGFQTQYNLSEIARPYLLELRDQVDEAVILTIRQRNHTVSVDQVDPEHPFRMVPHVGNSAPLYATAAGRAILFALPVSEQHRIIDELADSDVEHPEVRLDRTSWAREIDLAQSRGYVWIPRSDDVERLAAVVRDRKGSPLAAVSIYGPKYRLNGRIPDLGREARLTAGRIARAASGMRHGEQG